LLSLLLLSFNPKEGFCLNISNGNSKNTLLRVVAGGVVVVVFDWLEIGHGKPNAFMSLRFVQVSLLIGTFGEMLDEKV